MRRNGAVADRNAGIPGEVLPPLEAQGFDKFEMHRVSHECFKSGVL